MSESPAVETGVIPLLIFVPGLGRSAANTTDDFAEILARRMDNQSDET
jgi:hypothetical protein